MTKTARYHFLIAIGLIIISIIVALVGDTLYSPILLFTGFNYMLIVLVWQHIKKSNSSRLAGLYLIAIVIIYNLIGYNETIGIKSIFIIDLDNLTHSFRTILTLMILATGIYFLLQSGKKEISIRRSAIKISMVLVLALLIVEMPVYNIHGDLGGSLHGHSLIYGGHFH